MMSIERFPQSNQSNIIELNRTIAIRLLNAIEPQSNISNRGNVRFSSILIDYDRFCLSFFPRISGAQNSNSWGGNTVKARQKKFQDRIKLNQMKIIEQNRT